MSKCDLECLGNNILIITDVPVEQKGAILLPDNARQETDWCKVYRIGPGVKKIKLGDLVLRPEVTAMRGGYDFKLPTGEKAMVVNEDDIRVRRA